MMGFELTVGGGGAGESKALAEKGKKKGDVKSCEKLPVCLRVIFRFNIRMGLSFRKCKGNVPKCARTSAPSLFFLQLNPQLFNVFLQFPVFNQQFLLFPDRRL